MTINLIARGTTAAPLRTGYRLRLLLIASLAAVAGPALVLLLAFMTGCGIMTGMTAGPKER